MTKGNPKQFQLAKTMKDAGVSTNKVAKMLEKSSQAINRWMKYESWEDYCAAIKAARKPKLAKKVKKTYPKEPKYVSTTFEDRVLARLDDIEKLVREKKVIW